MKQMIILGLFVFGVLSCSKDRCQTCRAITESSFEEAFLKCQGYANSHPKFEVIETINLGELCGDDISDIKSSVERTVNTVLCPGVTYTVRNRVECQ
jgi:hypothetical protein